MPAPSLCPEEGGQGEQTGCRALGRCPQAGPWDPLLVTAPCLRTCSFSMVTPQLKPAELRFGLSLGGAWASLRARLTLVCSWVWRRSGQVKTTFGCFSLLLKPSQVPAQAVQGVLCSQLFPSKAPPCLQSMELGSRRVSWSRSALCYPLGTSHGAEPAPGDVAGNVSLASCAQNPPRAQAAPAVPGSRLPASSHWLCFQPAHPKGSWAEPS